MEVLLAVAQFFFILFMLGIILIFLLTLLLTWTWAQVNSEESEMIGFADILSTTGIEWGAILSISFGQILGARGFFEAPPLSSGGASPKQKPVIFVPSLHTGRGLFRVLSWRLRKHFFTSLWTFSWRPFLQSSELLEDQLLQYIHDVLKKTKSSQIRIVSFGSSRPIVSRVLSHPSLSNVEKKWVAISAPKTMSRTMKFLTTPRLKSAFDENTRASISPDLLIRGSRDVLCYPNEVFGEVRSVTIPPIGHYAVMLHPTTTQRILDELGAAG